MDETTANAGRPRYRWPYFLLAAVVLGIVLAVVWMSALVRRLREQRDPDMYPVPKRTELSTTISSNQPNVTRTNEDPLAEFRFALLGGNAAAGRKVFFEKPEANCSRCHKAGGQGGEVGPVLDGVGARRTREFILESIVFPNAQTTTNFETVIVIMKNGSGYSGTIRSENATNLTLINVEDGLITVRKSDIQSRQPGLSPMPEGLGRLLAPQDLRDLVEFVAGLK